MIPQCGTKCHIADEVYLAGDHVLFWVVLRRMKKMNEKNSRACDIEVLRSYYLMPSILVQHKNNYFEAPASYKNAMN